MYKYIGRTGVNGFINGNTYKLKYEYIDGLLLLRTPKGTLQFAIESQQVWERHFRKIGN